MAASASDGVVENKTQAMRLSSNMDNLIKTIPELSHSSWLYCHKTTKVNVIEAFLWHWQPWSYEEILRDVLQRPKQSCSLSFLRRLGALKSESININIERAEYH